MVILNPYTTFTHGCRLSADGSSTLCNLRHDVKQQHSKHFLNGLKSKKGGWSIWKDPTKSSTCYIWGDLSPLLGMVAQDALAPPDCSPSLCCRGRGVGVSSPSRVTGLPRRSNCGLLLSGAAVTAWIACFDCNKTGSSPTPNQMGASRTQQTSAH